MLFPQVYTASGFVRSCVICSDKSANVKALLDQWLREGKITPDTANLLNDLASKNVSVDEHAAALDKLVRMESLHRRYVNYLMNTESSMQMPCWVKVKK